MRTTKQRHKARAKTEERRSARHIARKEVPSCDVLDCAEAATKIRSSGEPSSRLFLCTVHTFRVPEPNERNDRFRTTMTYDDALSLMRAYARSKR